MIILLFFWCLMILLIRYDSLVEIVVVIFVSFKGFLKVFGLICFFVFMLLILCDWVLCGLLFLSFVLLVRVFEWDCELGVGRVWFVRIWWCLVIFFWIRFLLRSVLRVFGVLVVLNMSFWSVNNRLVDVLIGLLGFFFLLSDYDGLECLGKFLILSGILWNLLFCIFSLFFVVMWLSCIVLWSNVLFFLLIGIFFFLRNFFVVLIEVRILDWLKNELLKKFDCFMLLMICRMCFFCFGWKK